VENTITDDRAAGRSEGGKDMEIYRVNIGVHHAVAAGDRGVLDIRLAEEQGAAGVQDDSQRGAVGRTEDKGLLRELAGADVDRGVELSLLWKFVKLARSTRPKVPLVPVVLLPTR
jgi:hypothetical protein